MVDDADTRRAGDEGYVKHGGCYVCGRQYPIEELKRLSGHLLGPCHVGVGFENVLELLYEAQKGRHEAGKALAASEAVRDRIVKDRELELASFQAIIRERDESRKALAASEARVAALREALEIYAKRDQWFQSIHHQQPDGYPQPVWSWDDMREPWTMAQDALAAHHGRRGEEES